MDDVFALLTAAAVAFGPLSIAVTKLVDMLRNLVDEDNSWPKWSWNILAFVLALAVCVLWQLNVLEPLVNQIPALSSADVSGTLGYILTGLGVGAMASYWHERMDKASSEAKAANPPHTGTNG